MIIRFSQIFVLVIASSISGCDLLDEIDRIENPPSFNREMNNEHPFEVVDCHILYKGQRLDFNVPIEEWSEVLGDFYHNPNGISTHYSWHDPGILIRINYNRKTVSGIEWFYYREPENYDLALNPKNYVTGMDGVNRFIEFDKSWPKGRFSGSILLDGILMDDQFNIHELNQSRMAKGLNPFQESMWGNQWVQLRDCGNMELNFSVDPNDDDDSKVDSISFGISWFDPEAK